jgi:hypothetical protein
MSFIKKISCCKTWYNTYIEQDPDPFFSEAVSGQKPSGSATATLLTIVKKYKSVVQVL